MKDKGVTKDSLWACMLELKEEGVLTPIEEENIANRIERLD